MVSVNGGAPTTLAPGLKAVGAIAVNASGVYWAATTAAGSFIMMAQLGRGAP
jgi:hypothetical protein